MNEDKFATLLAKIEELQQHFTADSTIATTKPENGLLIFTEKEIIKMPKQFKTTFRAQGCKAHVRKRIDGRYNCSYEIRYAKKPYNKHPISASGTTLEEAKARFIEKLKNYNLEDENPLPTIPKDFNGFALYWFDNFHKRKVGEATYKKNIDTYKRDIQREFQKYKLSEISPLKIQSFLDGYSQKARTAETLHSIFNQIFTCAIKHGILKLNPLDLCVYKKHYRKHGKAISKENEKKFESTSLHQENGQF